MDSTREQPDYALEVAYPARVLAFTVTGLIQASVFEELLTQCTLIGLLGAYPHISYVLARKRAWTCTQALALDAIATTLIIIGVEFHLMTTLALVTALMMSAMVLGGLQLMAACLTLVLAGTGISVFLASQIRPESYSLPQVELISMLSSFLLLSFTAFAAYLAREETQKLVTGAGKAKSRQSQLKRLAQALGRYLSPQLVVSLVQNGSNHAATRRKKITVFFSDIEGFTSLMDNREEGQVTQLLNEYLNEMTLVAIDHGGVVDKFMGDGMMVFFGDPISKGPVEDAAACVNMALEMRQSLNHLRNSWNARPGFDYPLHIRIGIHTGYCMVGSFGSEYRRDYTVIGGAVNLASRLESLAGTDEILISDSTHRLVKTRFVSRHAGEVCPRGFSQPVATHNVLCVKPHVTNLRDYSRDYSPPP